MKHYRLHFVSLAMCICLVIGRPCLSRAANETCTLTNGNTVPPCWRIRITWSFADGLSCRYDYDYCGTTCSPSRFNMNSDTKGPKTVLDVQSGGWLTFKENTNGNGTAYMFCPSVDGSYFDWTDDTWDLHAPNLSKGCPILPQSNNSINCGCDSPYLSYQTPSYNPAGSTCAGGLDCFGCMASSTNTNYCVATCP